MKLPNITTKDLFYFIIIAIVIFFKSCEGEKTVSTPEIKGTLTDTIHDVVYQDAKVPVKGKTIYKNIVQQLIIRDTIKGDTIYKPIDTLKTQAFNKSFEDTHLKINANGTVTGRIEDLKLDYTIKPQEVKIPRQKRLGIGISIGYGLDGKPYGGAGINYNFINL